MTKTVETPTGIPYALVSQRVVQQMSFGGQLTPYSMHIGHVFIGIVYAEDIAVAQQITRDATGDDTARAVYSK